MEINDEYWKGVDPTLLRRWFQTRASNKK